MAVMKAESTGLRNAAKKSRAIRNNTRIPDPYFRKKSLISRILDGVATIVNDKDEESLSQRERAAEGLVRGTTSRYFYLRYPSPPLRGPSPVGRGIFSAAR
jgi:hypothetical protein